MQKMILFCGLKNPKDKECNFKIGEMKMDKTMKYFFGNYSDSIRTSGEVVDLFVRDKVVICKLVFFIGANLRIISLNTKFFLQQI